MIQNSATGVTAFTLLSPADHANTAAATGTAVDITDYDGYIVVTQQTGVVTAGTIVGKLQHGDAADGSDAADITDAAFTSVGTATDLATASLTVFAPNLKKYLRYVGTITTGPAIVGVSAIGAKKII
jgi:hypothetical protein